MRRLLPASALLSTAFFATTAAASSPAAGAPTSNPNDPTISEVSPAVILYAPKVDFTSALSDGIPHSADVVLKLSVSETGKVQDLQVVHSEDPALNGPVLDAVRKYRFRPAMQDNRTIPTSMNLTVKVQD